MQIQKKGIKSLAQILIFQIMNSVRSYNLSLKYHRFPSSGCKHIRFRKFEFVARTQSIPFRKTTSRRQTPKWTKKLSLCHKRRFLKTIEKFQNMNSVRSISRSLKHQRFQNYKIRLNFGCEHGNLSIFPPGLSPR